MYLYVSNTMIVKKISLYKSKIHMNKKRYYKCSILLSNLLKDKFNCGLLLGVSRNIVFKLLLGFNLFEVNQYEGYFFIYFGTSTWN